MNVREFFQTIQWGPTLQVAAVRIAIAAILWPVLMLIFGGGDGKAAAFFPMIFGLLFWLTAFVLVAIAAIGLARANVPWVGLAALPAWAIVIADPIVKLIHTKKPEWIPVDDFSWFNPPVLAVFAADTQDQNGGGDFSTAAEHGHREIIPHRRDVRSGIGSMQEAIETMDVGTPQERYERAGKLWDTKDDAAQDRAIQIYERLTSEGVDFAKPYELLSTILWMSNAASNSERIVLLARRLVEIEPGNEGYRNKLQAALSLRGKVCWDEQQPEEAFDHYLEVLEMLSKNGEALSQHSPVEARVAFLACRMFSKRALDEGNTEMGVRFFDWCETAGIDPNADFDIKDART